MIVGIFGRRHAIAFQKVLSREAFSELPAGPGRFYVVVVTGRFIRLEICTNQLSFSGSCQCVKLSARCEGTPEGECRGQPWRKEMSSNSPEMELSSRVFAPVEPALIFLDVEQQQTFNDMLLEI